MNHYTPKPSNMFYHVLVYVHFITLSLDESANDYNFYIYYGSYFLTKSNAKYDHLPFDISPSLPYNISYFLESMILLNMINS